MPAPQADARRRQRRRRRLGMSAAAAGVAAVLLWAVWGTVSPATTASADDVDGPGRTAATAPERPAPPYAVLRAAVESAYATALPRPQGRIALGIRDVSTGAVATVGDTGFRFHTASVVKSHILAALLLKSQDERRPLTAREQDLVTPMIRESANEPATALWPLVGGSTGMAAAYQRLGMTDTTPGEGGFWGLTTTTVGDQLRLLDVLHREDSPLSRASRDYQLNLMSTLDKEQIEGGVHTIADPGTVYPAKDGWLPRSHNGLWIINSIGRVQVEGRLLDVVALSQDQPSQTAGVDQVQTVLRRVAPAAVRALNER
ncbi:serine hydrolase [Streptomyces sp. NPDC059063]|uniref:serine hydrolase n=1 Tax=unclassified Streptomyces TaxID=2593676 RepID=UPI0036AA819A